MLARLLSLLLFFIFSSIHSLSPSIKFTSSSKAAWVRRQQAVESEIN
jgi:hypothetical protein